MRFLLLRRTLRRFLRKLPAGLATTALIMSYSHTGSAENLVDIYQLALKNDPALQAAKASSQAGATLNAQALARLLPSIDANYTRTISETNNKSGSALGLRDREEEPDGESYTVTLTQEIFNAAAFFGYRQAKATTRQSELQYAIEQQNLMLRASEAYFDVLRGKDNLSSSRAEEKAIAQQLEQTRQRYEVGLIAITDVHEAQAAYDLAIANRLTEEVQLGIAYESLAVLTGNQHSNLDSLSEEFPIARPNPESANEWVAFASDNNLSIQLAESVLKAANENAHVKSAAFVPDVQAIGRYNKSNTSIEGENHTSTLLQPAGPIDEFSKSEGNTVEIKVNLPLFTGGSRYAERKQAGYERVAEQANLVAARRKALQDTRSSFLTTTTDTARVTARRRAITSAESALEATQAGYDAGTRNIVDLLNAQRDLYRAERDYANTRYDYVINSLRLKQAAGTISPKDIEGINAWLRPAEAALKSESAQGASTTSQSTAG